MHVPLVLCMVHCFFTHGILVLYARCGCHCMSVSSQIVSLLGSFPVDGHMDFFVGPAHNLILKRQNNFIHSY
jgi:hypothetical protein